MLYDYAMLANDHPEDVTQWHAKGTQPPKTGGKSRKWPNVQVEEQRRL
jgi:hypothetical protein